MHALPSNPTSAHTPAARAPHAGSPHPRRPTPARARAPAAVLDPHRGAGLPVPVGAARARARRRRDAGARACTLARRTRARMRAPRTPHAHASRRLRHTTHIGAARGPAPPGLHAAAGAAPRVLRAPPARAHALGGAACRAATWCAARHPPSLRARACAHVRRRARTWRRGAPPTPYPRPTRARARCDVCHQLGRGHCRLQAPRAPAPQHHNAGARARCWPACLPAGAACVPILLAV